MGLTVCTKTLRRMFQKSALDKKSPYAGRDEQTVVQKLTAQRIFVLRKPGPREKLGGPCERAVHVRQLLVWTQRGHRTEGVFFTHNHLESLGKQGNHRKSPGNTVSKQDASQLQSEGELGSWEEGRGNLTMISSGCLRWRPKSMCLCFCAHGFRRAQDQLFFPGHPLGKCPLLLYFTQKGLALHDLTLGIVSQD